MRKSFPSVAGAFLYFVVAATESLLANPKLPFPQAREGNAAFSSELKVPTMNQACLSSWNLIRKKLIAADGCQPGELRVVVDKYDFGGSERPTYSEGIGWGMLFSAIMDREGDSTQMIFDGLNAYRKRYLMPSGFMNWRILANGEIGNPGVAVEAEENIAMGLLLAHMQWGSTDERNYLSEFRELTHALSTRCVLPERHLLKPGDTWGGEQLLHPANWKPAFWRVWEKVVPGQNWDAVRHASAEVVAKLTAKSPTGLPPHWCQFDGSPSGSKDPYFADYTFDYDALQLPIHNALHLAWYGPEKAAEAVAMNSKIAAWLASSAGAKPSNMVDGYSLDGAPTGKYRAVAFLASFMTVAASSPNASSEAWFEAMDKIPVQEDGYYAALIRLYALLVISGNFPDLPQWVDENMIE